MKALRWGAAAAGLWMGSCGSSGSSDGKVSSYQGFASQYTSVYCGQIEKCCASTKTPVSMADCMQVFGQLAAEQKMQVDSGELKFDVDAANLCLDGLRSLTSCDMSMAPAGCDGVVVGMKQPGEACTSDQECARGASGEATCDGTSKKCVQELNGKKGDACDESCAGDAQSTVCSWHSSSVGAGLGNVRTRCFAEDGLYCDTRTKTCADLQAVGAGCGGDDECASGYCSNDDSKCHAPAAIGAACDPMSYDAVCGSQGDCKNGTCQKLGSDSGGAAELTCGILAGVSGN